MSIALVAAQMPITAFCSTHYGSKAQLVVYDFDINAGTSYNGDPWDYLEILQPDLDRSFIYERDEDGFVAREQRPDDDGRSVGMG